MKYKRSLFSILILISVGSGVWSIRSSMQQRSVYDTLYEWFCNHFVDTGFPRTSGHLSLREETYKTIILYDEQPIAVYCYSPDQSKPYIAPLSSPSGFVLTRAVEEANLLDHPHHQGVFFAYGDVNGVDFWGNQTTLPQIRHVEFLSKKSQPDCVSLEVLLHWVSPQGTLLCEERRSMRFYTVEDGYLIDFDIHLQAKENARFGETKEGLFAIRVADWLREKGGRGCFYSASGKRGASAIWGTQESWVCLIAVRDNKAVLLGIQDKSESETKAYWHVRDYGLFAVNPLGRYEFETTRGIADARQLDIVLAPGESLSFCYRISLFELNSM
jgi:hypothetical protein